LAQVSLLQEYNAHKMQESYIITVHMHCDFWTFLYETYQNSGTYFCM